MPTALTATQLRALEAVAALFTEGRAAELPWPQTIRALVVLSGDDKLASLIATTLGQPPELVLGQPFDSDATATARKGSALLHAASVNAST